MNDLVPMVIMGICVFGTYKLFELFVRRNERMAIIEKLGEKISAADLSGKFTLPNYGGTSFSFGALKAGCLLLGVGLGLLIGFFISYYMLPDYGIKWMNGGVSGTIYGACVLLFGGAGLIAAFVIEMKLAKKDKE